MSAQTLAGCGKAMDPDMALDCSLGPGVTMSMDGSAGHSDLFDPSRGMSFGTQYG